LGARSVHIPSGLLGTLVDLSWRARLQHIDRGWIDLAFNVPLLDSSRARSDLDWTPTWTSTEALADLLDGVAHQTHTESPPLRKRSMLDQLRRDVTEGLISSRRLRKHPQAAHERFTVGVAILASVAQQMLRLATSTNFGTKSVSC
jgi:UDP-glucose 4-epimerase